LLKTEGYKVRKLFVANLSFQMNDRELQEIFAQKGRVVSARIATDRETGRSRGFGFVEMETEASAKDALSLSGQLYYGRDLKVMEARQEDRPRSIGGNRYVRREDQRSY
jgi:RNA recognition motif-containing protein